MRFERAVSFGVAITLTAGACGVDSGVLNSQGDSLPITKPSVKDFDEPQSSQFERLTGITGPSAESTMDIPNIQVVEGGLYGVGLIPVEEVPVIEITPPQFLDFTIPTEATEITISEPQLLGKVNVTSNTVIESDYSQTPDNSLETFSSNLPPEFVEGSRIIPQCEAVFFDVPNDVLISIDTTLYASIEKIPVEMPDDSLVSEQFAVAGTVFKDDFYFNNLEIGGTYIFSLDATVGVIDENIMSIVAGGIEPCEDEGSGDGSISSINGPADELSPESRAVRGERITVGD